MTGTLAQPTAAIATAKTLALERINRRLENTRGTLGAKVNLDGTVVQHPPRDPPKHSQPPVANKATDQLIYFGGQKVQERKATHGPGLAASIYSDMLLNLEKKKASQKELAEYERFQLKERAELKSQSKEQRIKEESNIKWLFENRNTKRTPNLNRVEELDHQNELRKMSKAYARELSSQIVENNKYKADEQERTTKQNVWNESQKFEPWNLPPRHHESRRQKPPSNADHHKFDLINHSPRPILPSNPKRRSYKIEDIKQLCPLNGPNDIMTNSLNLKNSHPVITPETKAYRQKTDVVQRKEPGPNNRLHDQDKDDPNEPGYFHFGRPGNGAPVLDGPTRSKIDASSYGHLDIVRELLRDPLVEVNKRDRDGWTALHCACAEGFLEVVEELTRAVGRIDEGEKQSQVDFKGMYWTVDGPIDLDAINDDDDTPEMVAMDSKKDEIMKILRDARAVLCDESHSKYTTTQVVAETHPDDIIENASSTSFDTSTTEGAVDVSVVTQIPSFESAVASTSLALSKMYKPERHEKTRKKVRFSPDAILLDICQYGFENDASVFQTFQEHLSSVQKSSEITSPQQDHTLLHLVCAYGHMELMLELLRNPETCVNARDWEGWTPLHCACAEGHLDIIKVLCGVRGSEGVDDFSGGSTTFWVKDGPVDLRAENEDGDTPQMISFEEKESTIAQILNDTATQVKIAYDAIDLSSIITPSPFLAPLHQNFVTRTELGTNSTTKPDVTETEIAIVYPTLTVDTDKFATATLTHSACVSTDESNTETSQVLSKGATKIARLNMVEAKHTSAVSSQVKELFLCQVSPSVMDVDSFPAKSPSTTHKSQFNISALSCEEFNQTLGQSFTGDFENSSTINDSATRTVEASVVAKESGNLLFGSTTCINMLETKAALRNLIADALIVAPALVNSSSLANSTRAPPLHPTTLFQKVIRFLRSCRSSDAVNG
ncbi:hypothetical protein HDU79_000810 [Rhizoclosmatium sp. JEL0117]|nr:hypothetical protein HDU79_000810 [Rhizoclosmatium sp. JEL0117]